MTPERDGGSDDLALIAVVDTESTGPDGERDEALVLALQTVRVHRGTGRIAHRVSNLLSQRQPDRPLTAEVERITGIDNAALHSHLIDVAAIRAALQGCDLVVAYRAGFDRPFWERLLPELAQMKWACAQRDVEWERVLHHSGECLDSLFGRFALSSDHSAEGDCAALVQLLDQPWPDDQGTGYSALLKAAEQPTWRMYFPDPGMEHHHDLQEYGYRLDQISRCWYSDSTTEDEAHIEAILVDMGMFRWHMTFYRVERRDAWCRYSLRTGVEVYVEADWRNKGPC